MKPQRAAIERARARGDRFRSTFFLAVLGLIFLIEPLGTWLGHWVVSAVLGLMLVAGVYAVGHSRPRLIPALLLAVPALVCDVSAALLNSVHLRFVGLMFGGLFLAYLVVMLV